MDVTEKVHSTWRIVQAGLAASPAAGFAQNPYTQFALMTPNYPDFIAYARAVDPDLTAELLELYARASSAAIDDEAPGRIAPRSRTAVHLYFIVRLLTWIPRRDLTILDVGGGYGNMARMLTQLNLCSSYDVLEIGTVVEIARAYHSAWSEGRENLAEVRFFNIEDSGDEERVAEAEHDLMISTFAMTEAPLGIQRWYLDRLAPNHPRVYIAGQKTWNGMNSYEQIRERLGRSFRMSEQDFPFRSPFDPPVFEIQATRLKNGD
jgi:hypothetical protein